MPSTVKTEAEQLIRDLPEQASWDDLMYEIHVRQKIEQGLRAADASRVVTHEEVRRRFAIGQEAHALCCQGRYPDVGDSATSLTGPADVLNASVATAPCWPSWRGRTLASQPYRSHRRPTMDRPMPAPWEWPAWVPR